MEWLIAHEDELNADLNPNSGVVTKNETSESSSTSLNSNEKKAQEEADKETTEMVAKKKITAEEAQRIINERQAKRAEEERKKAIEDEKRRRVDGQKMAETRAELQDQERIRLAQQIRKEKLEKEMHKKQLLDQIARDREAMREKFKMTNNIASPSTANNSSSGSVKSETTTTTAKSASKAPATECKLALRFPDGTSQVHKFSPQEQLAAVRLFVQMQKSPPPNTTIEFVAPPNKKLSELMMNDTLEILGLCPASRLEVKFNTAAWVDLD